MTLFGVEDAVLRRLVPEQIRDTYDIGLLEEYANLMLASALRFMTDQTIELPKKTIELGRRLSEDGIDTTLLLKTVYSAINSTPKGE